jgi:hypothetical protein
MRKHDAPLRDAVIAAFEQSQLSFALYGSGHAGGCGSIALSRAHEAYQHATIGLNVSLCNDFPAYSSDRIFRILGCGSLLLTKRFPMMSIYGLEHDKNCLVWDTPEQAVALAEGAVFFLNNGDGDDMKKVIENVAAAGASLARERHTWDARVHELVPLLAAVRGEMWS